MPPITFCNSCEEILTWATTGVFRPNDSLFAQIAKQPAGILAVPKDGLDAECPLCAMFEYLINREAFSFLNSTSSFNVFMQTDPDQRVDYFDGDRLRLGLGSSSNAEHFSRGNVRIRSDTYWNLKSNAFQYNLKWGVANPVLEEVSVIKPSEPRSTWSLASLNKVISWLSACKDSHPDCNTNANSGLRLPKRLVDVDPDGCISAPPTSEAEFQRLSLANMPRVRVCNTNTLEDSPQYLTLSHRWDPNPAILLSSDSLSQFLEKIPISSLNQPGSKTFRDAIFVTRCLGFRYLWIDAICINQRQIDDKGRETEDELMAELAIMDQIYANGACNISATSAKSAADGLFFDPLGLRLVQALKHRREQSTTPGGVAITFDGDFLDFLDSSPLNARGWVFQERMLSPRVIHFTNLQIYWECFVTQLSEHHEQCFHSKTLSQGRNATKSDLATSAKKPLTTGRKQNDPDIPRWYNLTHQFSNLSLSHPGDRLPAISALARHFQDRRELRPKDYIAGHWKPDLYFTLHWRVDDPRGRQDTLYLAPSWSWASVGRRVRGPFTELPLNQFADILDVSIVSENNDPFGKIKSGSIRLRCHISQAVLKGDPDRVELGVLAGGQLLSSLHLKAYLDSKPPDRRQTGIRGTVLLPNNGKVQFLGDQVFLALLCRSRVRFHDFSTDNWVSLQKASLADFTKEDFNGRSAGDYCGLILYPTDKERQFMRVGSFLLKPFYGSKKSTRSLTGSEDERNELEKRGKIRCADLFGRGDKVQYEFDSDDDEMFYGMGVEEAPIARALLGRFQGGNQSPTGILDAAGRQVIEIV